MGVCCSVEYLEAMWNLYSHYPVISMLKKVTIKDKFLDYSYISLGETLSSALLKYSKIDRKNHVISELRKIFYNINSKNFIIDNIDILFNPEYNIDILGFFIQLGRNRRIIVLWPGEYVSESLTYSSSEYEDCKKYLIKDYDVICLI